MSRSSFGFWGAELNDGEFAKALAAYGVLVAGGRAIVSGADLEDLKKDLRHTQEDSEMVPWGLRSEPGELMSFYTPPDAGLLARAWSETVWPSRPRLEIQPDTRGQSILPWIVEELSYPAVGARSVYLRIEPRRALVQWNWPLHVRMLDEADRRQLENALRPHDWGLKLCSVETIGISAGSSDFLILPLSLRQGLGKLLQQVPRARTCCILVLGGIDESWERAQPLVQALLTQTNASGVCIATAPSGLWASWFTELVREMSHDHPLDVALHMTRSTHEPPPLLLASQELITNARVSAIARDLIQSLRALPRGIPTPIPTAMHTYGIVANNVESLPPEELAILLETSLPGIGYIHESNGASFVAELRPNLRQLVKSHPSPLRWIQGQAYELRREGGAQRVERALRAGARHMLVVRIGPADKEWLTPPQKAVFPDNKLEWDVDQYELRVVFSEPNHLPEPQTATIMLPRQGASTTCQFIFQTRTDVSTFRGRVIVLHRNRVLQTALLKGRVVPDPVESPNVPPLAMRIEGVVRPTLEGLGARPEFDLAFIANHTSEGEPGLTITGEYLTTYCKLPGTDQTVADIQSLLKNLVAAPDLYPRDLQAKTNVKLLRDLAFYGSALYAGIVRGGIDVERLKKAHWIQVVETHDDFLPLEFVYEPPAPKEGAELCPNAAQALKEGVCEGCVNMVAQPGLGADYVCPMGFWCMRLVIESHWIKPGSARYSRRAVQWLSAPLPGASDLPVLRSAVFAASKLVDEVEPKGAEGVFETIYKATGQHATWVGNWDAWLEAVQHNSPSLLVLLPHMNWGGDPPWRLLEVGEGKAPNEVLNERFTAWQHVLASQKADPPLVLLLGCETLSPKVKIGDFSSTFRGFGAAIVLSTLTPVLGRDVAPVAEKLIQDLQAAAEAKKSFGYTLRDLRRQALGQGYLMVLCLTALGDTDWRLVPNEED